MLQFTWSSGKYEHIENDHVQLFNHWFKLHRAITLTIYIEKGERVLLVHKKNFIKVVLEPHEAKGATRVYPFNPQKGATRVYPFNPQ